MAYRDVILADNPVVYYRLGEASGTTAADEVGAHPGTYVGGPLLGQPGVLAGDANKAVSFDGVDDKVSIPSNAAFNLQAGRTVEVWVRADVLTRKQSLVARSSKFGPYHWGLTILATGQFQFWAGSASLNVGVASGAVQHVVGTHDGATMRLYVNGVEAGSLASTAAPGTAAQAVTLGAEGDKDFFDGLLDEVAIYNVALTAAKVLEHYQAGTTAPDTTPPAVPSGLAATPGNAQVALSWTANAESDLAGYRLYRDGVGVYDGAAATFTDATVTNGTAYSYTVSAYDTAGNESAKSTAVQATPTAPADTTPPSVPTGLTAAPGDAQVSLDWSDNVEGDLAGYRLYRGGVQVFDGVASTYLDSSAVNGTTYSYAVSAYDTTGNQSAQSVAVQATPAAAGPGLVAPHNRAVLTPRPAAQPPPDTYQAWLGPLRFVTVLGDVTETLGETIEAIGAALVAAERRPRPFKLTLPVRGDRSEADPYAAGLQLRRQVRQLIENPAWRNEPLYFWFGPDPDLQGWLLVGGGDLSYDDGGLVHSEFKLELTDCYLVGRPGQVRPARRLELTDHRGGTAPRDTRRTLYSTDHAAQALPAQPLIVPGDTVRLTGARRAPLDPLTTPGPTIAARALWRSVPVAHGDVVDYTPDPLSLPDQATALRDLDPPGRVRAWDVTAGIPTINSYTPTGDQDPAAGYGWGPVLGKPLRGGAVGAMDNGWCRVMSDLRGGIRIERLDLTAGTYVTVATVLTQETVLDIAAVELTAERAVIAARTPNREIRAVLQRGWDGPRLEVYHDALGAPTLLIVPQANYTLPAQNPAWVHAATLDTAARLLLAPVQANTTLTQETIDERSAIRLSQPAGSVPGVLVCQVGLALGGDTLTAGQVASRAICDARSVPTLVTAA